MKTLLLALCVLLLPFSSAGPVEDLFEDHIDPAAECALDVGNCIGEPCDLIPCDIDPCDSHPDGCSGVIQDILDDLPIVDGDGDRIPDAIEEEICGRQATRDFINNNPDLGTCASPSDYEAPNVPGVPPLGPILDDIHDLIGDYDQDFVPDDLEPTLCSIENQNSDLDGSCTGTDYHPPM